MTTEQATYSDFLATKRIHSESVGHDVSPDAIHPMLFPFQRALTRWAIRKGRGAIFADTGLGKTFMQLEWARLIGKRALIVAPLTVAQQTIEQAKLIGLDVNLTRDGTILPGINITNYEMIHHFDARGIDAVVLDESSILKAIAGKTRKKLTELFSETPYRLCCTATPAPNDIAEIANHAEFLGIKTRADMLATFFVHDDQGWRLKGYAADSFYRWMASWGMAVRHPSDIGYDDEGFILPELTVDPLWVDSAFTRPGELFFGGLKGIRDRAKMRKETTAERVAATAEMVNKNGDQWIVWCGLNDEGRMAAEMIRGAILVEGQMSTDRKTERIRGFQHGEHRVLVTKPRIAGFGMNFQHCAKMAFLGLSDSWESYYQCIRRCWRFGQKAPVNAVIVLSDLEREILQNVQRKEQEANAMAEELIEHVKNFEKAEIEGAEAKYEYKTKAIEGDGWRLMLGDSAERMAEIEADSVGLSVFSPPFLSLYTYTPSERDVGNSQDPVEFFKHFGFIMDQLMRVTMPGRNVCVHVAQVPALLARDGFIGVKDFRGQTIAEFERHGWVYHGEVCIDKNPQAQAIRTHAKALLFAQLKKDASWLRPALADYILVFRKPGDNPEAVHPDVDNETWIQWARPVWYGIQESDTLNVAEARADKDDRHICPLQLGVIERCIRLWSNPEDLVCDPFAGIGSTGHMAIHLGRRAVMCELKQSYFKAAARNMHKVSQQKRQGRLFAHEEMPDA